MHERDEKSEMDKNLLILNWYSHMNMNAAFDKYSTYWNN